MGFIRQLTYLLPIRLGGRRSIDTRSLGSRIYSNRRDPESGTVFLGDVVENARDEWFGLTRRVPGASHILRDESNQVRGSASQMDRRQ
jgi:hypothetical protein